jgi:hypothetical protein
MIQKGTFIHQNLQNRKLICRNAKIVQQFKRTYYEQIDYKKGI